MIFPASSGWGMVFVWRENLDGKVPYIDDFQRLAYLLVLSFGEVSLHHGMVTSCQ